MFGGLEEQIKPDIIFRTYQTLVNTISTKTNEIVQVLENAVSETGSIDITQLQSGINKIANDLVEIRNRIYQQVLIQNPNINESQANDIANRALTYMISNITRTAQEVVRRNVEYLSRLNSLYQDRNVIRRLFTISQPQLRLPELELNLSGNINQQIKAFVGKVDQTISKAIDAYSANIQIDEGIFTFRQKIEEGLENLNERISSTLDSLFKRITDTGMKLGFLTPEQQYQSLLLRQQLALRMLQTNPVEGIRMLISLSQELYNMGDFKRAFELFKLAQQSITRVPVELIEDFRKQYYLTQPESRTIAPRYLFMAKQVAEYDTEQAIKLAQKAMQSATKYADIQTYEESVNFLKELLGKRAQPLEELRKYGGRTAYIQEQILKATSPEIVGRKAESELNAIQMIDRQLRQRFSGIANYTFPYMRSAVVSVDKTLAENISSIVGRKASVESKGEYTESEISSIVNKRRVLDTQVQEQVKQYLNPTDTLKTFIQQTQQKQTEIKPQIRIDKVDIPKPEVKIEGRQETEPVYRLSGIGINAQQPQTQRISTGIPNIDAELAKIESTFGQIAEQFSNLKPQFFYKPSTSDESMLYTQSVIGQLSGIEPTLMPNLSSINFFGIESGNVLPNVEIPRFNPYEGLPNIITGETKPLTEMTFSNIAGQMNKLMTEEAGQTTGAITINANIVNITTQ